MIPRIAIVAMLPLFAAFFVSPPAHLHERQPSQAEHEQHHPGTTDQSAHAQPDQQASMMKMIATMRANDQKLDELVKKMNAATGNAEVDAIAELPTTLVEDRRTTHESMMSNVSMMVNMMGSMGTMHGRGDTGTPPKQ